MWTRCLGAIVFLSLAISCPLEGSRDLRTLIRAAQTEVKIPSLTFQERKLATILEGFKPKINLQSRDWLVFNDTGTQVAYVARYGPEENQRECVFVGDTREPEFVFVQNLVFSPDGSKVGYLAGKVDHGKLAGYVVVGNQIAQVSSSLTQWGSGWGPVFSRDGKKVAFVTEKNGKQSIVVARLEVANSDGKGKRSAVEDLAGESGPQFDRVDGPVFSVDGSELAYTATEDRKHFVMLGNERILEGFDEVGDLQFSGTGTDVVFRFFEGGKWAVMAGHKKGDDFDQIWGPAVSFDGRRMAYSATADGDFFVIADGARRKTKIFYSGVVFSTDGRRVNYWAYGPARHSLTIGDKNGPTFSSVSAPVFSPDASEAAYSALQGGQYRLVVGDHQSPSFDAVYSKPVFSQDGTKIGYGVLQGKEFWWKVMEIPSVAK